MAPSEAEALAARLARMKHLITVLDTVTTRTTEQQDAFVKLKAEIDSARDSLKGII